MTEKLKEAYRLVLLDMREQEDHVLTDLNAIRLVISNLESRAEQSAEAVPTKEPAKTENRCPDCGGRKWGSNAKCRVCALKDRREAARAAVFTNGIAAAYREKSADGLRDEIVAMLKQHGPLDSARIIGQLKGRYESNEVYGALSNLRNSGSITMRSVEGKVAKENCLAQ